MHLHCSFSTCAAFLGKLPVFSVLLSFASLEAMAWNTSWNKRTIRQAQLQPWNPVLHGGLSWTGGPGSFKSTDVNIEKLKALDLPIFPEIWKSDKSYETLSKPKSSCENFRFFVSCLHDHRNCKADTIQVMAESIFPLLGKTGAFSFVFFAPFFTPRDPGEALEGPQVVKVKPGDATLVVGKL